MGGYIAGRVKLYADKNIIKGHLFRYLVQVLAPLVPHLNKAVN
jgi:hypothetical protein